MSDNGLDDLLNFGSKKKRKAKTETSKDSGNKQSPRGLNPLDLINLPRDQRKVINWLSRRKQAHLAEIQEGVGFERDALKDTLRTLKAADYVHEAYIDGQVHYRVVFKGQIHRMARGMPQHLWARVELDNVGFLEQIPLFKGLPLDLLTDIAHNLKVRRYQRNEIILWQGDINQNLFLIKNGIVGITRLSLEKQKDAKVLAYRHQGDMFGEFSLFTNKNAATATVTALSEVNVLTMSHTQFRELLHNHHSAAMETMRVLTQRWQETYERERGQSKKTNISLVVGVKSSAGVSTIGSCLASASSHILDSPVVYTEYPYFQRLPALFGFPATEQVYQHPDGFDVFNPRKIPNLGLNVQLTLVTDRLYQDYDTVILGLPNQTDSTMNNLFEQADQIILVTIPEHWADLKKLKNYLEKTVYLKDKQIVAIANAPEEDAQAKHDPLGADYVLPYFPDLAPINDLELRSTPEPLQKMAVTLADQLERRNEIIVYIPGPFEQDGQQVDTTEQIEQTLAYLKALFGNVNSKQVEEEEKGEKKIIHLVQSRTTNEDLNDHLQEVIYYVEEMKEVLGQDSMAVEVNQSLILV